MALAGKPKRGRPWSSVKVLEFEVGCAGAEMVCVIRDQGIGIPEADREWLFSAFHRGHNVAGRAGTGLGLVIVKRCVDLHHGKILVESKVGKGTTITVRLPMFYPETERTEVRSQDTEFRR
jgi:signal transduction histidine kinase